MPAIPFRQAAAPGGDPPPRNKTRLLPLRTAVALFFLFLGVPPALAPSPAAGQGPRLAFPGAIPDNVGMEDFLREWGYLGIFLGIIATGAGFPMPEELPVVVGGVLVGTGNANGWIMLPVCIAGVILGDSVLYFIGRFWGPRIVELGFIKRHVLTPERMESIRENFHKYGIKILLFARLTPGIRAPIFLMAGITRLPLIKFVIADGVYAVPGVSILFGLGWYFTDTMVDFIKGRVETVKTVIIGLVVLGVLAYFLYRYLRKPVVTGDPHEMPPGVEQVTHTLEEVGAKVGHTVADMTSKIIHPKPKVPCPPVCPPPGEEPPPEAAPANEPAREQQGPGGT